MRHYQPSSPLLQAAVEAERNAENLARYRLKRSALDYRRALGRRARPSLFMGERIRVPA